MDYKYVFFKSKYWIKYYSKSYVRYKKNTLESSHMQASKYRPKWAYVLHCGDSTCIDMWLKFCMIFFNCYVWVYNDRWLILYQSLNFVCIKNSPRKEDRIILSEIDDIATPLSSFAPNVLWSLWTTYVWE